MPSVRVRENEPFEAAIRRFKRCREAQLQAPALADVATEVVLIGFKFFTEKAALETSRPFLFLS
jgi:hypothetical protein